MTFIKIYRLSKFLQEFEVFFCKFAQDFQKILGHGHFSEADLDNSALIFSNASRAA